MIFLRRPVTRTQRRGTEPARSDSFSYNGRNELTGAALGAAPYGYSYDNIGNRKTAQEPAQELAYAANELNQYARIEENAEAPFVPTYDASGNQTLIKTSTGVWTVVYNAANRAVSFTSRDGATVVECGYDYQGRRYMKKVTVNGTVASHERCLYRGYLQIAALDMLNSRNVLRTLLWDPLEPTATRPLALVQGASLYCYGVDFNKNVTEVFDARGTIAATYDYSPYGTVGSTGNLVQPVQWSSEMNDEEPALAYYNYRYYNPADGRWINRDPIAEEGGWNLYGFVRNVPMICTDYLGKDTLGELIYARYVINFLRGIGTVVPFPSKPAMIAQMRDSAGMQRTFEEALQQIIKEELENINNYPKSIEIDFVDKKDITAKFSVHLGYESGVHLHSSGWWLGRPQKVLGYGKFKICVKSKDDIILLSSEGVSLAWYDVIDANPTEGDPEWQQFLETIVQDKVDSSAAFPIEVWGNFTFSELETIINSIDI